MEAGLAEKTSAGAGSPATVLCVDDEPNVLSALKRTFRRCPYRVHTATSGDEGLKILERESVDVIISDMRMPAMNGSTFLTNAALRWPSTMRFVLTGYAEFEAAITAINNAGIYRYLSKPWNNHELRTAVSQALHQQHLEAERVRLEALTQAQNEELAALNQTLNQTVRHRTEKLRQAVGLLERTNTRLKDSYRETVEVFVQLLKLRDDDAGTHAQRVAYHARAIASQMGFVGDALEQVYLAGLLHDIGELALPDAIARAPIESLSGQELEDFHQHAAWGAAALMSVPALSRTGRLIRSHHERFDGTGYPDGLAGTQIPLGSQIIAVASSWDEYRSGRHSGHPLIPRAALVELHRERDRRFSSKVIDAFIAVLARDDALSPHTQRINPSALMPGMVLSEDLVTERGIALVPAGQALSDELITKIRTFEALGANALTISVHAKLSTERMD
ncbi:MAG: response regulator [Gammaproteobacteria bacterium]|nr:response regulator [Gammaproteobacteria bacterium]